MPIDSYEIRVCAACGLRYPLVDTHAAEFGIRCPACLGETRVALSRSLLTEPKSSPTRAERSVSGHEAVRREKAVLLDNIRAAWNVGAIFRSADGFGFAHAYLCGITPTPEQEGVQKTSLGAENSIPWSYHKDAVRLVERLREQGFRILALEKDERAVALDLAATSWRQRRDTTSREVLILGNEVTGVDPEMLDLCDSIYCIPMLGQKRSFNVAIAFGIAAYVLR